MNKLKEQLKPILGDKVPTPPNPNAQQVCWQIKLNIEGRRKKFTGKTEQALYQNIINYYGLHNITVQSYFEQWLNSEEQSSISYSTRQRKIQRWAKHFKNTLGTRKMTQLSFSSIEDEIKRLQAKGITVKELSESLNPLRGLCRKALREGILSVDPMEFVKIDYSKCIRAKKQNEKPQDRVFQEDEMERVLAECDRMIMRINNNCSAYYGIKLLRLTGMRVGELVALHFNDFDDEELILHIHSREVPEGKNRVVVEGIKGTRTLDKSVITRDIPITQEVIDIVNSIRRFNLSHGYEDEDYVFLGKNGRSTIKAIENALWNACRLAKLEHKKSPHDIRRTVATVLYRKGITLKQIQYYLGHSDIETTKGYIYDDTFTTSYYNNIRQNI
ncbi:MAG: tyrosine-type recombinase/integrase [Butyrivibrio sp.]|nr:tyrosine-type recombinase/integrase [Butyrivibrio sp.]